MKAIRLNARTYSEAAAAAARHVKPALMILQVAHDDGCPALRTLRDSDCRPPCRPDFFLVEPFAEEGGPRR